MTKRAGVFQRRESTWCRALRCGAWIALALIPIARADAQVITVKTVPLAEGDQFGFLPSANLAMGGVAIALPDTLLDPFVNPAKASRLRRGSFFGSPSFYNISRNAGSGRTLPLGAIVTSGSSFGGVTVAIQEISPPSVDQFPFTPPTVDFTTGQPIGTRREPRSNQYASALIGRALQEHGLSFGASVLVSRLNAVDGVEQLYMGSQSVDQSGQALDVRIGFLKEWAGNSSLEAVAVYNRFGVTHDVNFLDPMWDPATRTIIGRPRLESFQDRTRTTGLHVEYERPLADSGWRVGGLVTANRITHPELPDYEFAGVPRDAGHSAAFNVGLGLSKISGPAMFGLDVIYEPIWSRTGTESLDNRFRFSNSIIRAGLSRDFEIARSPGAVPASQKSSLRLQFGTQLRSTHYRLDRQDNLTTAVSSFTESWNEWSYTWGASLRFPEVEVHYRLRSTSGAGRPGVAPDFGIRPLALDASFAPGPFPPAPPLLGGVRVTTQQFSISLPIR